MQHCLICQAGDYGSVTRAVTVPDALERLGSILRFLFNYYEDLATGRPQARRTEDFDLHTLAALLDTQTNFQEQLKVPETPPPKIVQTILDYVQADSQTVPA